MGLFAACSTPPRATRRRLRCSPSATRTTRLLPASTSYNTLTACKRVSRCEAACLFGQAPYLFVCNITRRSTQLPGAAAASCKLQSVIQAGRHRKAGWQALCLAGVCHVTSQSCTSFLGRKSTHHSSNIFMSSLVCGVLIHLRVKLRCITVQLTLLCAPRRPCVGS